MSTQAERGRRLLAEERDVSVQQLSLDYQQVAVDPDSGDEFWVGSFRDEHAIEPLWVGVDPAGSAFFLPDFTDDAIGLVAGDEDLDPDDLEAAQVTFAAYPFSRQVIWLAVVLERDGGESYPVVLDLSGAPVDIEDVEEVEATARSSICGAVDGPLCAELLMQPEGHERYVQIDTDGTAAGRDVVDVLEESDPDFRQDGRTYFALLPKETIMELGHKDGVRQIIPDSPDLVEDLDSNIWLSLGEASGQLFLELATAKDYATLNHQIISTSEMNEITRTGAVSPVVTIDGILVPAMGPGAIGPARGEILLDAPEDLGDLVLTYENLMDTYELMVDDGEVTIEPGRRNRFTWPMYDRWLRLPTGAIWFVVQSREQDSSGQPLATEKTEFVEKADAFYADLVDLGAEPLLLEEGVYTHRLFVAPWPDWQVPDREYVQIPIDGTRSYLFRWPDIRYFTYGDDLADVETLMEEHCVAEVWISGYTWMGDVLDACQ